VKIFCTFHETGCEGFQSFEELTLSPSSGCAGGLVMPKLMTGCCTVCCISIRPVARWNVTPLDSGRSQQVVELGLGCLFHVVESVSVN